MLFYSMGWHDTPPLCKISLYVHARVHVMPYKSTYITHSIRTMYIDQLKTPSCYIVALTFSCSSRVVKVKTVDDVSWLNEGYPPTAGHHVCDALRGRERSILTLEDRVRLHGLVLTHRTTLKYKHSE